MKKHPFDEFTAEQLEEFMCTEDYEQLDELSKKTLGSYVKKASRERGFSGAAAGASSRGSQDQKDHVKTMKKRQAGVIKAVDRLTKEAAFNESVRDFIINVAADKNADALQAFHNAIGDRVAAAVDAKRIEVAQSMIQRHDENT